MNKKIPQKWTDIYEFGTQEGNEESRFFIALSRNPKYEWRSVAAIAKESKLSKEKVENIITKYYKFGMVYQNPEDEDYWAYWERVPHLLPNLEKSICEKDKKYRINKKLNNHFS